MSISNAVLRNPTDDDSSGELTTIFSDREFYMSLERFCNQAKDTKPEYESFLQYYFNDEGYVDIWRIPHAMMDVLLHRMQYNRVFESREFRKTFQEFVRELLAFCSKECPRNAPVAPAVATGFLKVTDLQNERCEYLIALTNSFSRVLEILASEEQ